MAQGTQVVYQPGAPIKSAGTLRDLLQARAASFAQVLPSHMTVERLFKLAQVAVSRQPKLLDCTQSSILDGVMRGAELGLDISGALGHAYLVPFRNGKTGVTEATFIPGYKGLLDLARRSGAVKRISAHVIREKDQYELEFGTSPKLTHKPCLAAEGAGKPIAYYMVAELEGGQVQIEVMTQAEVDAIRRRSKAANNGPWVTDPEEMGRKTVLRRGLKYCPLSPEKAELLGKALEADEDSFLPMSEVAEMIEAPRSAQAILDAAPTTPAALPAPAVKRGRKPKALAEVVMPEAPKAEPLPQEAPAGEFRLVGDFAGHQKRAIQLAESVDALGVATDVFAHAIRWEAASCMDLTEDDLAKGEAVLKANRSRTKLAEWVEFTLAERAAIKDQ